MSRHLPRCLAAAVSMAAIAISASLQSQRQQPPALGLESVAGRDSFEFYCAPCHGNTGKGDGPAASALKSRPANLASLARRTGGAFPKDRVLAIVTGTGQQVAAHGSSEMPVWGPIFSGLDPSEPRVKQRIENVVTSTAT